MSTSLFTGLSGLRAFETNLDVIGNNIANSNTVGYRGSRVSFGDLLSINLSPGSAPSSSLGGTNPTQIGLGVGVKSIDLNTNPGSLLATNRNLDLTVFGSGFFVVNDGSKNFFTRAGTFGFDGTGTLVDLGTGFKVLSNISQSIVVPADAITPPQQTENVTMKGNLPAVVTGPLPEILSTANPFATGTSATIDGTNAGPFTNFSDGDSFTIQVDSGPPQTVTLHASDFAGGIASATAAEVATAINAQITGATASAAGGMVHLSSDTIGEDSNLKLTDISGTAAFDMGMATVLVEGTESAATAATDINDLVTTLQDYDALTNDGIEVTGIDADGNQFQATFVYGTDGTTLGDLRDFVQSNLPDATVAIDAQGNLTVTANTPGAASYALSFDDSPGNVTGQSEFSKVSMIEEQEGTDPDTVNTAITVYDRNGQSHVLSLTFERVDSVTWQLTASLPDEDGTLIDDSVTSIRFNADGSLQNAGGTGDGDPNILVQFASGDQEIALDFGSPANGGSSTGIEGITQFGGPATAQATQQDGYASGTLADVIVTEDGTVRGVFTNGQTKSYGTIGLASFANPGGLRRESNNLYSDSVNSGVPLIGSGGGTGGLIQSGVLENSNVDLAESFVKMIEAQRGYQASARVIRASEDLLQSLLQNI